MPSINFEPGDGKSGAALALGVVIWLGLVMTLMLGFDAYSHREAYVIPQFMVDLFVHICMLAVGGTTLGAGIGLAIHSTNKRIEEHTQACVHLEDKILAAETKVIDNPVIVIESVEEQILKETPNP